MNFSSAMPGGGDGFSAQDWMRQWQALFAPLTQTPWPGLAAGAMPGAMPGVMPGFMSGAMPGWGAHTGAMMPPVDIWQAMLSGFSHLASEGYAQARQAAAAMATPASGAQAEIPDLMASFWQTLGGQAPADPQASLREALSEVPVGPLREHIERWQQAVRAQLDYQQAASEFGALLRQITQQALARFEQRLAARAESGEPIQTPRALFDEWIEAGEAVWGECANSDAFITTFGRYGNAELRLRAALQDQLNRVVEALGLPTRSEVDADHRRIAQLERELRRVQAELAQWQAGTPQTEPRSAAKRKPEPKPSHAPEPARAKPAASVTRADKPARAPTATRPKKRSADKPASVSTAATRSHGAQATEPRRATARLKRRKSRAESAQASVSVLPQVAPPRAFGIDTPAGKNGKRKKQGARA